MDRAVLGWAALGSIAYVFLPWYAIEDSLFGLAWLARYPGDSAVAPALVQGFSYDRPWLLPVGVSVLAPIMAQSVRSESVRAAVLLAAAGGGIAWVAWQGFAIGGQPGVGVGGVVVTTALLMLLCLGLAAKGSLNGDRFVTGALGAVIAVVIVFVFFPVSRVLVAAVQDNTGAFAPYQFWTKFSSREIWGLDCMMSSVACGVAWNTLFLGLLVGASTTALGMAFALAVTRTEFRGKKVLRTLTVLPIITPPFVIG